MSADPIRRVDARGPAPRPAGRGAAPAPEPVGSPAKAALDGLLAAVLLVLAGPVMLAAMAVVKLTSRGPALYRQTRVGRDGWCFTLYKIRTMVDDCERATGPRWATPDDPRITPVGRFLRRTHIDELPQLWNVLRGEMSLVGPRPERPEFVAQLERVLPRYRERLRARPGLTGLAQVQLPADTDLESVRRKLACDAYYIRRTSVWLDLRILLSTAAGVLGVPFAVSNQVLRVPSGEALDASPAAGELGTSDRASGDEIATQAWPA